MVHLPEGIEKGESYLRPAKWRGGELMKKLAGGQSTRPADLDAFANKTSDQSLFENPNLVGPPYMEFLPL